MRSRATLAVACALICSATATATSVASARAAEPVEVARVGKVTLLASDEKRQLCIQVDPEDFDTTCADPGESVATVTGYEGADPRYLGAAVPAAAARVEVRRAGALVAGGPTTAGEAYKGVRAGTVRFVLLRLPSKARADGLRIRAFDAGGALLSVIPTAADEELVIGRARLLAGRADGVRWSLVAEQRSELTPSTLDPGHETVKRCVSLVLNRLDWGTPCVDGLPIESLDVFGGRAAASAETCNPPFRVVYGVVDASVPVVNVLLGNGRVRNVPTVPLGATTRAYAVATRTDAVASVTLPGRGIVYPGFAPLSAVCAGGGRGLTLLSFGNSALGLFAPLFNLPPLTPNGPITQIPGSPGMQVADGPADTLCVAVAGEPFDALGCAIVPPLADGPIGAIDDLLNPHALAFAVPARVAAVRLLSADGKVVMSIPTVPGAGYSGRYAGHVRFASARIANPAVLAQTELLDAAGAVLYREDPTDDEELVLPRVGAAHRIAGRAGRPSLWQTNARLGTSVDRCLALTDGSPPPPDRNCQTSRDDATVLLDASCATHRLSVGIAVRRGTRVLADTGRSARRAVRLRRGAAVLTLPSGRPLRSLTFVRRGRSRRVAIDAPPGARQCGWHLAPSTDE